MLLTRRELVKQAALSSSLLAAAPRRATLQAKPAAPVPLRIGMTDWNLGKRGDNLFVGRAFRLSIRSVAIRAANRLNGWASHGTRCSQRKSRRNGCDDSDP